MFRKLINAAWIFLALASCRPTPVEIDVPQQSGTIIISSSCPDEHSVLVSASYSANSLIALLDTSRSNSEQIIPKDLLIDSAIVTLHDANGTTDTLYKITSGIWGRRDLQLRPGAQYQLNVFDYRKNRGVAATTSFLSKPVIDSLQPIVATSGTDTTVKLRLAIKDVIAGSNYIISYNTMRNAREQAIPLPFNRAALNFAPKKVELITAGSAQDGILHKEFLIQASTKDTLMVSIAQIDKASYDYYTAYKRTGVLINQLTGEPINLPGNITGGIGLFTLSQPIVRVFDLNNY